MVAATVSGGTMLIITVVTFTITVTITVTIGFVDITKRCQIQNLRIPLVIRFSGTTRKRFSRKEFKNSASPSSQPFLHFSATSSSHHPLDPSSTAALELKSALY